jgi:flagellar hook-basal body complex protein FliE
MSIPPVAASSTAQSLTADSVSVQSVFGPVSSTAGSPSSGFADLLKNALHQVSSLEDGAQAAVNTAVSGNGTADLGKVMISVEKADVAFQLMMQVRNKIVSAYQEVEKMQF